MFCRDSDENDRLQLQAIHRASGMDYLFPDLDSPLFITRKVLIDDDGNIIGAAFLKVQAETYLMLDPTLGPRQKMDAINRLNPEVEREAWEKGLDTLVAYIPEDIDKKFDKRLLKLGWERVRAGWKTWFRELAGK
jgi:hypothetical protein